MNLTVDNNALYVIVKTLRKVPFGEDIKIGISNACFYKTFLNNDLGALSYR